MPNYPSRDIMQLPIWPEPVRGGPNALLRSAFFAGIASKKRKILGTQTSPLKAPEGVEIIAQAGVKIKYAGVQLNQYDADVFFEALHLARRDPLETECLFTGHSFLKSIGRAANNLGYEDLDDSLRRLEHGTVDVEWIAAGRPYVFTGHLISNYTRETNSKLYKLTFAKEIRTLFAPASWTQLEWEERMALKGGPLAQWLHSFFSTHAVAHPVTVEYLHRMSGSPTAHMRNFKIDLRAAMDRIQEVIGWQFVWDGDRVTVTRTPSGTQIRHLSRKTDKAKRKRIEAAMTRHEIKAPLPRRSEGGMMPIGDIVSSLIGDRPRRR